MRGTLTALAFVSLILSAAIFGFFYAWVCSTMWGLDRINPATAIEAMQAMNASVRNGVFAPAFFGTPLIMVLTAVIALFARNTQAAIAFGLGGLIYAAGGMFLTFLIHIPLNEALALVDSAKADATVVWAEYSPEWQFWNQVRTGFSGLACLCAGWGLWALGHAKSSEPVG
jgi:uncharacterized membrane protein